jgi:hypothetical protein
VQGRQLIAQRLSGTGGHDGQGVAAFEHTGDHLLLAVVQPGETEGLAQRLPHGKRDDGSGHDTMGASRIPVPRCPFTSMPLPI